MDKTRDFRIEMRSDPKLLCGVRGLIRQCFVQYGLDAERVDEIVLAVDEACSNALRHAYDNDCGQCVWLEVYSNSQVVEIRLHDAGRPIPAEALKPRKQEPVSLDTLRPGGLGVQLIRTVFDEVEFAPGDTQGNCVTMRVRLPQAEPHRAAEGTHGTDY